MVLTDFRTKKSKYMKSFVKQPHCNQCLRWRIKSTFHNKKLRRPVLSLSMAKPLLLIADIDDTIVGPEEADVDSAAFRDLWLGLSHNAAGHRPVLAYNSGRNLPQVHQIYTEKSGLIPKADWAVCGVGTRIYSLDSTGDYIEDLEWTQHISADWDLGAVLVVLENAKNTFGLENVYHGDAQEQHEHKQTLRVALPVLRQVLQFLETSLGPSVLLVLGGIDPHLRSVDVLPARSGKGNAAEYLRSKLNVPFEHTVVAGNSGNDIDMLLMPSAQWHAIVVSNAVPDLMDRVTSHLQQQQDRTKVAASSTVTTGRMVLSGKPRAAGVVDGLRQLGFLRL